MEDISLITATFTWDSANSHYGAPALRVTAAGWSGYFGPAEQLWPLAETRDEGLLDEPRRRDKGSADRSRGPWVP